MDGGLRVSRLGGPPEATDRGRNCQATRTDCRDACQTETASRARAGNHKVISSHAQWSVGANLSTAIPESVTPTPTARIAPATLALLTHRFRWRAIESAREQTPTTKHRMPRKKSGPSRGLSFTPPAVPIATLLRAQETTAAAAVMMATRVVFMSPRFASSNHAGVPRKSDAR